MLHIQEIRPEAAMPPRTIGRGALSTVRRAGASRLAHLHQSGAMKILFPRRANYLEAIIVNTSGGVTGGDRLSLTAKAGEGSTLCLTTQAAERAYRAIGQECGCVTTELTVEDGGTLLWMPQELILYEGCALSRSLDVALQGEARFLMVEPVIFGRAAMGERLSNGRFQDRVRITKDAAPIYRDGVDFSGNIAEALAMPAHADGAGAMANLVFAAPEAEAHLSALRVALEGQNAGVSLLASDLLCLRLLARDGFELRQKLLPVLDRLSANRLPRSWRL